NPGGADWRGSSSAPRKAPAERTVVCDDVLVVENGSAFAGLGAGEPVGGLGAAAGSEPPACGSRSPRSRTLFATRSSGRGRLVAYARPLTREVAVPLPNGLATDRRRGFGDLAWRCRWRRPSVGDVGLRARAHGQAERPWCRRHLNARERRPARRRCRYPPSTATAGGSAVAAGLSGELSSLPTSLGWRSRS